jgi:hypothetical protein
MQNCVCQRYSRQLLRGGLFLLLLCSPKIAVAEFVEVIARFDLTSWRQKDANGKPIETTNGFTARCVVATNTWVIEHDFLRNGKRTHWFVGSNIVIHTVITKKLPRENTREPSPTVSRIPEVGERFTTILETADGAPTGDLGVKLPWLAFCSGTFLKLEGRQIPLPMSTGSDAFAYKVDKTATFADSFGLPKIVEFYATGDHLKCRYHVLQSTNVAGWNFPSQLELRYYRPDKASGKWEPHGKAVGHVLSIQRGKAFQVPADVSEELETHRIGNLKQPVDPVKK